MDIEAAYQRHWPSLLRYVSGLVGNDDVAEDVCQDAFVKLLSHAMPDAEVRKWLFTVATNLVRDNARSEQRHRELWERHGPRAPVADPAPPADEALERAERVAAARAALDTLTERDRELLLLRQAGFKYDEMARMCGVARGSIGTMLGRAMRRFASALDPEIFDGNG